MTNGLVQSRRDPSQFPSNIKEPRSEDEAQRQENQDMLLFEDKEQRLILDSRF